jgi:hypothetical protein
MNISKIMLAAAIAAGFVGGAMAVTTADYVQDGLVGHWDGIDNAGTGTHNPTAAKWKDLTGLTGDGTLAATAQWKDIGWYNNSEGKPVVVGGTFGSTLNTGTFTLEVTIKPMRANTRETILGAYSTGNWNFERNKDNVDGRLRYWFSSSPDFVPSNAQLPTGESGTIALAASSSSLVVYKNGVATDTRSGSFTLPQSGVSYVIGGEHNRPAMAFCGNYYSVRLYSRALDADELLLNSAIDQVRLLGKHPSEVTFPSDRRIDNNLNIVSNRAGAATLVWRGAAGGRWADAANWSLNGEDVDYAPMELDTAVIASGAAPVVDAGQEIRVAAVVYADAAANPGTYTGSGSWGVEVPWLSGAGVVRIASSAAPATATWTGNGVDTKVTTPAN